MATKAELGIFGIMIAAAAGGFYFNDRIFKNDNLETCHKDSRTEQGALSCTVVDEGKTLPFATQIEIYGATKEDMISGLIRAMKNIEKELPVAIIIGSDLNKYGYKINTFVNVPKPPELEQKAPEAKKPEKKKK